MTWALRRDLEPTRRDLVEGPPPPQARGDRRSGLVTHIDESARLNTMTKRLQVLLDDEELAEIQDLARRRHQTTAAWVREALRVARDTTSYPETGRKLRAIREAVAHEYPTRDVDDMNREIERGYGEGGTS